VTSTKGIARAAATCSTTFAPGPARTIRGSKVGEKELDLVSRKGRVERRCSRSHGHQGEDNLEELGPVRQHEHNAIPRSMPTRRNRGASSTDASASSA
jgi:hypothetical protein